MLDKKSKKLNGISFSDYIHKILLYIFAGLVIFPVFWIIYTSFKTNQEFVENPWALGEGLAIENYIKAWTEVNFSTYTLNSIIISLTAVFITTVFAATTSYILVRFRFKFNALLLMMFLAGLYIPTVLLLPSEFLLLNSINGLNNRFVLIILYVVFSLPYSILILSGFFRAFPREIEEAALIDGCGNQRTFWQIVFPLSKNGVITTIIFNFIWIWNDYMFTLTFVSDDAKQTLPVGLIGLQATFRLKADWVTLFAGLNMVMIPSIILYILFQKQLQAGLVAGAVKG